MPRESNRSFAFVMMGMGTVSILATCVPLGFAFRALTVPYEYVEDATVSDLMTDFVHDGEVVHLRAMRDRSAPQRLVDGRVLYPTLEDAHVMVQCGEDDCAGYLVGTVETLAVEGPLPAEWPVPTGERVRIVHVDALGDEPRSHALLAASMAGGLLLLGVACVAAGVASLVRGRKHGAQQLDG